MCLTHYLRKARWADTNTMGFCGGCYEGVALGVSYILQAFLKLPFPSEGGSVGCFLYTSGFSKAMPDPSVYVTLAM